MHGKRIYLERLFPQVIEKNLLYRLKIDCESVMYITIPEDAEKITNIIIQHLTKKGTNPAEAIITDSTAGVGGDTISFSSKFRYVNSIELDRERYNYLTNNVNAYKLKNVVLYCDDMMKIIPQIEHHDVIFVDPPWGGRNYKRNDNLRLHINDISIEDCCLTFSNKNSDQNINTIAKSVPKLIVLKLPSNYDIDFLKAELDQFGDVFVYKLTKMTIVVFEPK
ncbi:MAG: putative RNA methylase [Terrestrivirus sp.]|uniref:Putative RNA methylase n=1 Tax=Terrestrivirus sp. TaxID=2487775 RepID=A0A3G4ZM56_9VIRU|nr:MAG: putative RNA methylase [Terrestrivirus sp.]